MCVLPFLSSSSSSSLDDGADERFAWRTAVVSPFQRRLSSLSLAGRSRRGREGRRRRIARRRTEEEKGRLIELRVSFSRSHCIVVGLRSALSFCPYAVTSISDPPLALLRFVGKRSIGTSAQAFPPSSPCNGRSEERHNGTAIDSRTKSPEKARETSATTHPLPTSKLRLCPLRPRLHRRRRLTLLAHLPHLPQRLDEVVAERFSARLGAGVLRLDPELDHFVAGEICGEKRASAGGRATRARREGRGRERNAQLIPYPSGQIVPNPVPKNRSPALNPLVDKTQS